MKSKNYCEFPYTLYRNHTEIEVTVTGYESEGLAAKYSSVLDDDSYPEEPGSFEISSVYDDEGNFYTLTEDEEIEINQENFNFE
jgi:hypothetical protein